MTTLSFWGGTGTVTGSKYLIEGDGGKVLVDCGLFQGFREWREKNWEPPPFDVGSLDAVVITHAHVDHTAYLPRLVALGYDRPVYCSRGTAELLKLLLPDSARLQEEEAEYRNRKNLTRHSPALPLYTEQDARAALKLLRPQANRGEAVEVGGGMRASFTDRGAHPRVESGADGSRRGGRGREGAARAVFGRPRALRPADHTRPRAAARVRLPARRIDVRRPPARPGRPEGGARARHQRGGGARRADPVPGLRHRAHAGAGLPHPRAGGGRADTRPAGARRFADGGVGDADLPPHPRGARRGVRGPHRRRTGILCARARC